MDTAFQAWKAQPSPESTGQLLRAVRPVLDTAVSTYASGGGGAVRGQARLMAVRAFQSYDPAKGPLKTHLLSQLRGLQRYQQQQQQPIRIPERVLLDRNTLTASEQELRDELGRDPSDAEISRRTGLSARRLAKIRQVRPAVSAGQLTDDAGQPYSPASQLPGDTSLQDAWTEFIYGDLGPVDQAVMDYTLGLHGSPVLTNQQLAGRLNLSPGAISQRKAKIQRLLDEQFDAEGLP